MDLDGLTLADFTALDPPTFDLDLDEAGTLPLTLVEATPLGSGGPAGAREPFSLVFAAPLAPELEQRARVLRHPALGELIVFLVPIARQVDGMRYEAVFA